MPNLININPRITVVGVGGAGGNVVNNMIAAGLSDVQFVVANTDVQALASSKAENRIQLGASLTEGLGAGSDPEIGEAAAEETIEEIRSALSGSHMVFIASGMGGGTGTGAAYVFAREAHELGILTIAVVTKPFQFEGSLRLRNAEAGIAELRKYADTLLVIPNENLFRVATNKTTFADAFVMADQVMYSGIVSIADLIVPPCCLVCRASLATHHVLCGPCWREVHFIRAPLCDVTGMPWLWPNSMARFWKRSGRRT